MFSSSMSETQNYNQLQSRRSQRATPAIATTGCIKRLQDGLIRILGHESVLMLCLLLHLHLHTESASSLSPALNGTWVRSDLFTRRSGAFCLLLQLSWHQTRIRGVLYLHVLISVTFHLSPPLGTTVGQSEVTLIPPVSLLKSHFLWKGF